MTIDDIDIVELNEAFAAQVVPCREESGIDPEKLNPFGGAIALGHPFGMTGARIMTTLLNDLDALDGTYRPGDDVRRRRHGPGDDRGAIELTRILFVCMGNICRSPTAEGSCAPWCARPASRTSSRSTARAPARGTPAIRPTAAPPQRPKARGVTLEGAARQVRPRDFEHYDLILAMDRENLRELRTFSRRTATRRARRGCCASSTRPRPARRPRRARPVLRRPGRLRAGARPGRGRLPRPARRLARGEPRGGRARRHRPRRAVGRARRRRRHQRGVPRPVRRRVVRVRQDPRGRRARRVRRRGGRRCAGWPSRARCACPRCSASPTTCSCSTGSTRAAAATAPRSARASRRCTRRARTRSGRRLGRGRRRPAAAPRAARASPNDPAPDWPDVLRRAARCCRCSARRRSRASATARSSASATGMAELAGPPEPPARLHGDLWSGNVLWGRDGRPWLIDPAAYGGHREVDLAMLRLFGSPGPHVPRRLRGAATRSRPATRSASSSTSCSRCSCTRRCSAAATPRRPSAWPARTP